MAQPRTAAPPAPATVGIIAPTALAGTAIAALRARGITARAETSASVAARAVVGGDVIAWALDAPPAPATAVEIAAVCAQAASAGRPICVLAPPLRGSHRAAVECAAALAFLRAHGAAVVHDVDVWLEATVLLVRHGLPAGPRTAVIAPPGSWLAAQAHTVASELEAAGGRAFIADADEPTDAILYDPSLGPPPSSRRGDAVVLTVPVAPRVELAEGDAPLYTARAALAAIEVLGRAAERMTVGLGPASATASTELGIDDERLRRQLAKLASDSQTGQETRLGDHETKVLLSAYGVPITRQAVATTPSAAVKLARRAGFPVEIKPWGHDLPTEPAGCPVEKGVTSDALVRAAFTSVLAAAGKSRVEGAAVIVRETPPAGREVAVSLLRLPALGWTVVLEASGAIAAAPAPLRLVDAQTLAAHLIASRAGDADLDRAGLANLLRRASHLVVDQGARLASLELSRIIVGGRGARTLVVDAHAELQ